MAGKNIRKVSLNFDKNFVVSYQHKRRRWQNFRHEQQEDNQWQQNTNAKCNFLSGFGWQVENQHAKEWNQHSWKNQIDGVEECLASNDYVECDVGLGWRAIIHVQVGWHLDNVPSTRLPVIR